MTDSTWDFLLNQHDVPALVARCRVGYKCQGKPRYMYVSMDGHSFIPMCRSCLRWAIRHDSPTIPFIHNLPKDWRQVQ